MVEAVIMLPVFGLILIGTLFIGRLYLARLHALATARNCAFAYAVDGCRDAPPGCRDLASARQSAQGQSDSTTLLSATRTRIGNASKLFDDIPVLGDALSTLFGTTARAVVPVELQVPWDTQKQVHEHATIALACNEHPRDLEDAIEHLMRKYLPVLK